MDSSQFVPPAPRAASDSELQEVLDRAKSEAGGVLAAMQILEAQSQLRETDKSELNAWRMQMLEIGTPQALLALENQTRSEAGLEPLESIVTSQQSAEPEIEWFTPSTANFEFQYVVAEGSEEQDATAADEKLVAESQPFLHPAVSSAPMEAEPVERDVTVVVPNKRNAKDPSVSQFWVWLTISGSLLPLGIALWLQSLGLTLVQSSTAAILGIFVSAGVVAIGAIAGKRSSLPTLVLSRAAFGVLGNLAPSAILVISRLFWSTTLVFLAYLLIGQSYSSSESATSGSTALPWLSILVLCALTVAAVALSSIGGRVLVWAQRVSGVLGVLVAIVLAIARFAANQSAQQSMEPGSWLRALGAAVVIFAVFGLAWSSASADYASGLPVNVRGWKVVVWAILAMGLIPAGLALLGLFAFSHGIARDLSSGFTSLMAGSADVTPLSVVIQISLICTLVTTIGMSLRSSSMSFEAIKLKFRVSLATPVIAVVAVLLAVFGLSHLAADGFWLSLRGFALVLAVPVGAWSGIFVSDVLIRRIAYHEVSLSRSYGFYKAVNLLNLLGWLGAVAIGWGLVRVDLPAFRWLGYFSGFASNQEFWAQSNFGVVISFAIGLLLPVLGGIPRIKQQEREVLLIEGRRNDLKDVLGLVD
jgi:NCS1 family nucleobase:cation symporter-1